MNSLKVFLKNLTNEMYKHKKKEKEDSDYGRETEERSQSDEDEDYVFLMSILASITELDVIQRMELRMDFLTSICLIGKRQFSKNLSLPCNSFHPTSLISCHPTLFLHSAALSPNSDTSTLPSQMPFILSAHLLLRQYQAQI